MWLIGGTCVLIIGIAAGTLKYIIDIAGDMAETKSSCHSIADSLSEFKQENERDHSALHVRIDGVKGVQEGHALAINTLQNGSC